MTYQTVLRRDRARGWDRAAYRRARLAAGLTWGEIAEALGVSVSSAHRWGTNGTPPASLLPGIATTLGVPQRKLLR